MIEIIVVRDFTDSPGGRHIDKGPFSGEEFREKHLKPKYMKVKSRKEKLTIDLDGTYGYFTSFLDEAFRGLAKEFPNDNVLDIIEIKSDDQPSLIEDIANYTKNN